MASYGATCNRKNGGKNIEGIEGFVPYKGPVADILDSCEGGIQSTMSYVGAGSIEQLRNIKVKYRIMTESGKRESGHHGITIQ